MHASRWLSSDSEADMRPFKPAVDAILHTLDPIAIWTCSRGRTAPGTADSVPASRHASSSRLKPAMYGSASIAAAAAAVFCGDLPAAAILAPRGRHSRAAAEPIPELAP